MIDDTDLMDRSDRPASALITAEKVKGTEVYNSQDEKLGSIDSIMIDKMSGEVAYVVMSFGGFLGLGEKFHPLPWHVLDYDPSISGYRVDLDRNMLEGAPAFGRDEVDNFDYDRDGAGIDSYYSPETSLIDGAPDTRQASVANDGVEHGTGSDANDGRGDRPLGFYSSEAQAKRSNDVGAVAADTPDPRLPVGGSGGHGAAGHADTGHRDTTSGDKPGFYSPEQQQARNPVDLDNLRTDNGGPTSEPANIDGSPRR